MARFSLKHNIPKIKKEIDRKIRKIDSRAMAEVEKEAHRTHRDLVSDTPLGYTGNTRKAWRVRKISAKPPSMKVHNDEPVMLWLEEGTRRRFPKKAKNLFIPLRNSAWRTGRYKQGMKWGKDFVFAKSARGIKALKLMPKQASVTHGRISKAMKAITKM